MNLLLIDDHPIILEALATMLVKRYPNVSVSVARTSDQLVEVLKTKVWSGVFVDINFNGDLKGLEIIENLKSMNPASVFPVIAVSMRAEAFVIKAAIEKGACGYVVKMDPAEEIFQAFERYGNGQIYLSATAKKNMDDPSLETSSFSD